MSFLDNLQSEKFNDPNYRSSTKFIGDILEISTALFQEYEINNSYEPEKLVLEITTNENLKYRNSVDFEIDVMVKIKLDDKDSRIIIFECKNWTTKTVRPIDVIYFKEKIYWMNEMFEQEVTGSI